MPRPILAPDAAAAALAAGWTPPPTDPTADTIARTYNEVVTRYGGQRHLAHPLPASMTNIGRHSTLCRGTSSWTIASWGNTPDHPTLTAAQMRDLPLCPTCLERTTH